MKTPYKLSPTTGVIPVEKIVGRTKEIEKLHKALMSQSVVIEEIRRMGKTLFLKKYAYVTQNNQQAIYFTLQGKEDAGELIDHIIEQLNQEKTKFQTTWNGIKKIYNKIKPEEITIKDVSFKLPEWKTKWKEALTACLTDIAHRDNENNETLILILDELPIMLWDWIQAKKIEHVKEFLDVLRANRQLLEDTGKVRLVICGSVGINVVLNKLKQEYNYTGEPFNDMLSFDIEAMTFEDAYFLCECLLMDDFIIENETDKKDIINEICMLSERLPFYINQIFNILRQQYNDIVNIENINQSYQQLIHEPKYNKTIKQLDDRITTYYSNDEAEIMKSVLDFLSKSKESKSDKEIINELNIDKNAVKQVLYTLKLENYLDKEVREEQVRYSFKYNLFKQWWKFNMA